MHNIAHSESQAYANESSLDSGELWQGLLLIRFQMHQCEIVFCIAMSLSLFLSEGSLHLFIVGENIIFWNHRRCECNIRRYKCGFVYPINWIVNWCMPNYSGHFIPPLTAVNRTEPFPTKFATTDTENFWNFWIIFENSYGNGSQLILSLYPRHHTPPSCVTAFVSPSHTRIEFEKLIPYSKQVQSWNNRRQIK